MTTAQILVNTVSLYKEGSGAKGPWKLWHLTDAAGTKYSTFQQPLADAAMSYAGKQAEIDFEENEKGKTLKAIRAIVVKAENTNGSEMTKEDWEVKERRVLRTAIYKSFLEGEIGKYVSAMSAVGKDKTPTTTELAVFLDGFAAELISRAEKTIWGSTWQAEAANDDDGSGIPF